MRALVIRCRVVPVGKRLEDCNLSRGMARWQWEMGSGVGGIEIPLKKSTSSTKKAARLGFMSLIL